MDIPGPWGTSPGLWFDVPVLERSTTWAPLCLCRICESPGQTTSSQIVVVSLWGLIMWCTYGPPHCLKGTDHARGTNYAVLNDRVPSGELVEPELNPAPFSE